MAEYYHNPFHGAIRTNDELNTSNNNPTDDTVLLYALKEHAKLLAKCYEPEQTKSEPKKLPLGADVPFVNVQDILNWTNNIGAAIVNLPEVKLSVARIQQLKIEFDQINCCRYIAISNWQNIGADPEYELASKVLNVLNEIAKKCHEKRYELLVMCHTHTELISSILTK